MKTNDDIGFYKEQPDLKNQDHVISMSFNAYQMHIKWLLQMTKWLTNTWTRKTNTIVARLHIRQKIRQI